MKDKEDAGAREMWFLSITSDPIPTLRVNVVVVKKLFLVLCANSLVSKICAVDVT